ncbi:MAG: pilus assembly protein [Myxococcales bacterium]|nr:pilus assembly protein [Myxococcales bacterium]
MRTRCLRRSRGAAMVEFAIISTLMVPIIMYAMYFVDLGKVRIKTAEVARYTAWEFTSYPLSNYETGEHEGYFDLALENIRRDVISRYADDLRSDTLDAANRNRFMTGSFSMGEGEVVIENQEANFLPGPQDNIGSTGNEMVDKVLEKINQGVNKVLGFMKFNTKGQIRVDVTIHYANEFIPKTFAPEFYSQDLAPEYLKDLALKDHLTLVADAWTLLDGEDVYPWGGYQPKDRDALFFKQLNRVTVWGMLVENIPGLDKLDQLLSAISKIPIFGDLIDPNPFGTRLASIASRGDNKNDINKIPIDVDCGEGLEESGSKGMHTTPHQDKCQPSYDSEYVNTYLARGPFYMGCKTPQADDCFSGNQQNP